jgi:hypothetical protein
MKTAKNSKILKIKISILNWRLAFGFWLPAFEIRRIFTDFFGLIAYSLSLTA